MNVTSWDGLPRSVLLTRLLGAKFLSSLLEQCPPNSLRNRNCVLLR